MEYFASDDYQGFSIRLINHHGTDEYVVSVAHGTITGAEKRSSATTLLDHLIRNRHTSPIEFAGMAFEIEGPNFILEQILRHRTFHFQKWSGRYSEHDGRCWLPRVWRSQGDEVNRQVGDGPPLDAEASAKANEICEAADRAAFDAYKALISLGVCREQARSRVPAGFISRMSFAADTHNLMHFLTLRLAPDAQAEVRWFAEHVAVCFKMLFPKMWASFENHRLCSVTLSGDEIDAFRSSLEICGIGDVACCVISDGAISALRPRGGRLREFTVKLVRLLSLSRR